MKQEAQFLLDRLDEYDPEDEDHVRDFHGHVAPAIARLRYALQDPADRPLSLQNALKRSIRGLEEWNRELIDREPDHGQYCKPR